MMWVWLTFKCSLYVTLTNNKVNVCKRWTLRNVWRKRERKKYLYKLVDELKIRQRRERDRAIEQERERARERESEWAWIETLSASHCLWWRFRHFRCRRHRRSSHRILPPSDFGWTAAWPASPAWRWPAATAPCVPIPSFGRGPSWPSGPWGGRKREKKRIRIKKVQYWYFLCKE